MSPAWQFNNRDRAPIADDSVRVKAIGTSCFTTSIPVLLSVTACTVEIASSSGVCTRICTIENGVNVINSNA